VVKFVNTVYKLPVHDLMHRPGENRELSLKIDVPERLGESLVAVTAGSDMVVEVRLEVLHDGILVSGNVDVVAEGECGRCLTEMTLPLQVEFAELFAYSVDEAFDYEVHDDHVDLEPLIRDAVVLALPFQPVCRPDCAGLDPETGDRLAARPDSEPEERLDPRWSALGQFQASTDTGDDVTAQK
jgi:uncharacterized protein